MLYILQVLIVDKGDIRVKRTKIVDILMSIFGVFTVH